MKLTPASQRLTLNRAFPAMADELRIQILPAEVVNQIAAGEVVERPASVVKELVENAIDAGAHRVDVAIEGGGLVRIRVVDDGSGMAPAEAELALERHATSKLRRAEQLFELQTMGFRGEALPSIASVSRLILRTRPPGSSGGWSLQVEGGVLRERAPDGCRVGTVVEVAELFFNTPARRRFMKSTATETAHVTETVQRLSLASPAVHFTLEVDGRQAIELPACAGRLERVRAVLGRRGEGLVLARLREDGVEIDACLSPPTMAGRSAQSVSLIANRRYVRERTLLHAVLAGYGELVPAGRYPLAVVHLDLDPRTIDVNVHPQKTEVRLADPGRVHAALRRCVAGGVTAFSPSGSAPEPGPTSTRRYQVRPGGRKAAVGGYEEQKRRILEAGRRFWSAQGGSLLGEALAAYRSAPEAELPGPYSALRVIGQALGSYLICEGDEVVVLIEIQAARERLAFEELSRAADRGTLAAQRLLVPVVIRLDPELEATADAASDTLRRLGVELESFGGASFAVRAIPALLQGADPEALVRELLGELARSGAIDLEQRSGREALLARMAGHGSSLIDHELDEQEQRALLLGLDRAEREASPRGHPVAVWLERAELERRLRVPPGAR
jgi:DNA mismatch repair protein MutL